jgi:hypothetical protein
MFLDSNARPFRVDLFLEPDDCGFKPSGAVVHRSAFAVLDRTPSPMPVVPGVDERHARLRQGGAPLHHGGALWVAALLLEALDGPGRSLPCLREVFSRVTDKGLKLGA